MDLNGPNANLHYRGMHHQHDEVRLIDYARLCEHLSPRKIILLQLFRTIFHRLVIRFLKFIDIQVQFYSLESTIYTN